MKSYKGLILSRIEGNACRQAGFSLLEVIVVIAITTFLTGIFLGYTRGNDKQIVLFRDRDVLIGSINYAKSLASQKFNTNPRACAFGVNLTRGTTGPTTLRVFQDLRPQTASLCKDVVTGAYQNDFQFSLINDAVVSTYEIDDRIAVTLNIAQNSSPTVFSKDILFIPPELIATTTPGFPVTIIMDADSFHTQISVGDGGQIITQ